MRHPRFLGRAIACGLCLTHAAGQAAPYPLAQSPRNTALPDPPPNVIVSVDNSTSMAYSSAADEGTNPSPGTATRMEALKTALKTNFSSERIADGRIRLAWQAMNDNMTDKACAGFFGDTPPVPYRAGRCRIGGRVDANLMRPLEGAHRENFMQWVDGLTSKGGTPLHAMMTRAGEYMTTTGRWSPYSDEPGTEGASTSSCRRSFHIFMTDGEYNFFGFDPDPAKLGMPAIGNADGTERSLPDGQRYQPRPPFADQAGAHGGAWTWDRGRWWVQAEYRPTLADMTFHYWASDLQPGIANKLWPVEVEQGDAQVGERTVASYWNPRNNPATWQHLTTHTIGFGSAAKWSGEPSIDAGASQPTYSGGYASLVEGRIDWPDPLASTLLETEFNGTARLKAPFWFSDDTEGAFGYRHSKESNAAAVRMDLWHAALNSRGTFTPALDAQALSNAFDAILQGIQRNTSVNLTSISADSTRIVADTAAYQAGYDTADWSGRLTATRIRADGKPEGAAGADGKWVLRPSWSARELLDARMAEADAHERKRVVLSHSRDDAAGTRIGVPFRWERLSGAQRAALQGRAADAGDDDFGRAVLAFLRGDRSNEGKAGLKLRERAHVLGDIVNSSVWYAGQPKSGFTRDDYAGFAAIARAPMVYVGANDGMLHAFDARTGEEAFAYVPEGLYGTAAEPGLGKLSDPLYAHRYYVDGSPFVADLYMGDAADGAAAPSERDAEKARRWQSFLVGTLGAGGKGYFVLDVTRPQEISESSAAATVVIDATALADDDLGHQFQEPVRGTFSRRALQVAPLNNGRKALILGNGYNSASEKAALWVQYLDGDREVLKIFAPKTQEAGAGNGLSAPYPVDHNNDGTVDEVYAGDLLGNLWRFDLSGSDAGQWKATLGSAAAASGLDDKPLFSAGPAQPITAAPLVVDHPFGGHMVMVGTGRLFAAGDESSVTPQYIYGVWDRANGSAGTAALSDLVAQTVDAKTFEKDHIEYRTGSKNPVRYGGPDGKRGWYLALPSAKERVVHPADALDGNAGLFSSTIPGTASDSVTCTPGASDNGWSMVLDFFSGAAPDGVVYNDLLATANALGFKNGTGRDDLGSPTVKPSRFDIRNPDGEVNTVAPPQYVRRFGWRDLISP